MKKLFSRLVSIILISTLIFAETGINVRAAEETEKLQLLNEVEVNSAEEVSIEGLHDNYLQQSNIDETSLVPGQVFMAPAQKINITQFKNVSPVVVLIKFPGEDDSVYSTEYINKIKNSFSGETRSLKDYISKISNGICTINPIFAFENNSNVFIYTAPYPKEHYMPYDELYNPTGYKTYIENFDLLVDAFVSVKNNIPKDVDLDVNDDGQIDGVEFFFSAESSWNTFLWPTASGMLPDQVETEVNGAVLTSYNIITKPYFESQGYRVICHEFLHTLSLPDMYVYNTGAFDDPAGYWTMMSKNTGYPTVRERMRYGGWILDSQVPAISTFGTYTLKDATQDPKTNTIAYKIPIPNSEEFFMVEYRDKSSNCYEEEDPSSGIIVYRVNPSRIGNATGQPEVYILRNSTSSPYTAALDGRTDHKYMDLVLSSGEKTGYRIKYVSNSQGIAQFELASSKLTITSTTSSLGDTFKLGKTTEVKINADNNGGDSTGNKYSINVDGQAILTNSTLNTVKWTPTKTGKYTINMSVTDNDGSTESQSMTITVTDPNKVVIYYKGFENPYIHYKIDNGQWTNAPGIRMTPSTEQAGYNYKAEIDLGNEYNLTACFNNGNGQWDSNGGNNYKFAIGSYTMNNGVITKLEKKIRIDSFTANTANIVSAGQNVILNASASNNTGDIQYKFSYINNTTGTQGTFRDYSKYSVLSWLTITPGNYTLILEAKDSLDTVRKELNFTVEAFKDLSITSVNSSLGDKVNTNAETAFTINTVGGYGNNVYSLSVNGEYILNGSSSNKVNWIPTKPGTYKIEVQVISMSSLVTYEKTIIVEDVVSNITTIYYKGYDTPYIHYKIGTGQWTSAPGIKMVQSNEVAGYNYKAVVDLGIATSLTACFNNGGSQWDSNNGNNYVFNEGYYVFESGKISKIEKPQNTLRIDTFTTNPVDKVKVGNLISLAATVSNNTGNVTYKFSCKNNTTGEVKTLVDYNVNSTTSWLAEKVGNYTFTVEAKDSLSTIKKEINFVVEEVKNLTMNSVTSSLGDKFRTNMETTLTVNADGGIGAKTYTITVNDQAILLGSTSNTINWTPTKAGTYKIFVQVNTIGVMAIYEKTITVEDVSSNKVTIYYKGYTNPYIHYQIGSGQWTIVPGIKMTPCTEVAGYEYKAIIDLGTATTLNACFNNGYGAWDSRNGSNYNFGVGNYSISNGVITKL